MNKTKEFNIARLRIEEDFGFQKRIEVLTVEADKPMMDSYKAALALVNGEAAYATFINHVNVIID